LLRDSATVGSTAMNKECLHLASQQSVQLKRLAELSTFFQLDNGSVLRTHTHTHTHTPQTHGWPPGGRDRRVAIDNNRAYHHARLGGPSTVVESVLRQSPQQYLGDADTATDCASSGGSSPTHPYCCRRAVADLGGWRCIPTNRT